LYYIINVCLSFAKANPPRDGGAKSWTPPRRGRQTAEDFFLGSFFVLFKGGDK